MKAYLLDQAEMPWGDYGSILLSGMSGHRERWEGRIQLERTGPFIPPLSFPGLRDIVVTASFRHELERSGLTGLTFQPVLKRHIVHLEWDRWDRSADEPVEYPESGEPEDYILEREHSPATADAMGELWEACLGEHADVERVPIGPNSWEVEIYLRPSTWDGTDWFYARGVGYIYVSERAKIWLEARVPEWITCQPARQS